MSSDPPKRRLPDVSALNFGIRSTAMLFVVPPSGGRSGRTG